MTTTLSKKDRSKVDADNKFEVEYLHLQYPWYTHQQIKEVIKVAGPLYTEIDKQLRHKQVVVAAKK